MPNRIEAQKFLSTQSNLDSEKHKLIAHELGRLLADTYLIYLKTQNYHWNVTGQNFSSLHLLFEQQYRELALAIDLLAERIRALGEPAPGSLSAFSKLSHIKEEALIPGSSSMVQNLLLSHETLLTTAKQVLRVADENEDDVTADMMISRMQAHEKFIWMLRSVITAPV